MEALNILEEKLASLVSIAQQLKKSNEQLRSENEMLKFENTSLVEEKSQLTHQLKVKEESAVQGSREIDELYQEKKLTKSVVDNLIKSIEFLVEKEDQL